MFGAQLIFIPKILIAIIKTEANKMRPYESGGVLMGVSLGRKNVLLTNVVGPGPTARHERFNFEPDYLYQEAEISRLYAQSGGTSLYLGDWHSHPGGTGALSNMDKSALQRIAEHLPAQCRRPMMLIVSGGPDWDIALWQLVSHRYSHAEFK